MSSTTSSTAETTTHDATLPRLFERQAQLTPDAVAVESPQRELTYAELEGEANRLARFLLERGLEPEQRVGLGLGRSIDMIVALLAVTKAGGAYLPLDPAYPEQRLRDMTEDSGTPLVLGLGEPSASSVGRAASGLARWIDLDSHREEIAGHSPKALEHAVAVEQLAYIIYTSGSTGRPKGVLVSHRGLANLSACQGHFAAGPGKRVLQFAPFGFDASVFEMVMALATGATLCLTSRKALMPGPSFIDLLAKRSITHLTLPPSVLGANPEPMDKLPELENLVCAGEELTATLVSRWGQGRRMWNAYGPTEATVWTSLSRCRVDGERPDIGEPLPGMPIYLVGPDGRRVEGVEDGEMWLGGRGVARGYLGKPALTAERFVPDPWSGEPGGRLYRSGDRAQALEGGRLDFRGRLDQQVKIRGFRIEPGEIEATLAAHPSVRESAVVIRQDGPGGEPRLVGYAVPEGETTSEELLADLHHRLPEHMVPSALLLLEAFPRTANDKLDRTALPSPEREDSVGADFVAPRDAVEEELATICARMLGLDRVGVNDDFFALGGHSLLIGQLAAKIRDRFDIELPLADLFALPTVAAWSSRLAELRQGTPKRALPPFRKVPRDEPIPLTFPQERVWFLNELEPDSIAYNAQATIRFEGPLDHVVYRRALTEVVRRHEVFRTRFPVVDGRPVQQVQPPVEVALPIVDLQGLPASRREAEAEHQVRTLMRWPFEILRIPLARWVLFRLAPEDHMVMQMEHHFVHDGWAFGVLMREVRVLYEAFAAGEPSPLPEPALQCADFAVWQRDWMQGEVLEEQLAYWTDRLAGGPEALQLPSDRPRPKRHTFRGAAPRIILEASLNEQLRRLCRRRRTTLYKVMLAAFKTLLLRYSGQRDLLVGTGAANRRSSEIEEMIGMVVNTLVLRTDLGGDPTFDELLGRISETCTGAFAHPDVPLEKLVQRLAPDRDLSVNPLFQVLFSFHDSPLPDLDFCGLKGEIKERHNGSAKSDLNIVCIPRAQQKLGLESSSGDEETVLIWEYSSDLFDKITIDRMVGHYLEILKQAAVDSSRPISRLPLLSAAEEAELASWRGEPAPLPEVRGVHELVEARAAAAPEALAATGGGRELSYGELSIRSSQLAHDLIERGVGTESLIAVFMRPSPDLLVALLAVLKAGGAYLPLDPSHPEERLAYTLTDADVAGVLTESSLLPSLPASKGWRLAVDVEPELARRPSAPPISRSGETNLAYVIYTSGSTGRPKGTELPHRGLLNLVSWHCRTYDVRPTDRATQIASLAFDASVWEIWPYLAAGASLHFPDEDIRLSPQAFYEWLARSAIDLCFLPTPFAEAMLVHAPPAGLRLRALLVGGDKLRRAPEAALPFRLVNHYGPTEGTVVTTALEVPCNGASAPPIGRAIDNTRVEILDRGLGRQPVKVPGELLIGTVGLARGYLGRPALTAECFVPDPYSQEPGGRLYKSGDLGRVLRGGDIQFLGRTDHQVKLRGFRIELGEIEARMAEHPGVSQAAVAVREAPGGEPFLAGFYVPAGRDESTPSSLSEWLDEHLPSYMVPAVLATLDALPISPNGKLDRAALPTPEALPEVEHVAPRTVVEELLAEIWVEVLGREGVGVRDDFFALGGHSLLAGQVLSRLREEAEVELPLRALFEQPTIEGLAECVEEALMMDLAEQEVSSV